ncbi:single-stranded-DNA-specific exonuclease RecJ, partial [candidate division TA06 bacterium]|nr:single-stranded-DNA-specific exonuclease RecJ [candidate division TA06 bacterium]
GTTGTALLLRVFHMLGGDCDFYLPHRLREGYGLSREGIKSVSEKGAKLIITVDCGITAHEEVKIARELGMEMVVTDHHELKTGAYGDVHLPPALAVLNPKQEGDEYPFKDLSGCGLAYKLAEALVHRMGKDSKEVLYHLDLVALATVADVVPLKGENRIFASFGMKVLEKTKKSGLRALLSVSKIDKREINAYHIGFVLGPRLNAMGRLASASETVRLLTTENAEEGLMIAKKMDEENRARREIEKKILEEALEKVQGIDLSEKKEIVLAQEGWHEGVIGIVASRLVEKFHRPTFLIALDGDRGKGSGRSIPGFHLFKALLKCEENLISFGGHKQACGLTLRLDQLEGFQKSFEEVANSEITEEGLRPKIFIDSEIEMKEIEKNLYQTLVQMEPYGSQNPRPLFLLRNVEVVGHPRVVGERHLKFRIRDGDRVLAVIGFGFSSFLPSIQDRNHRISLVFSLKEDEYLRERRGDDSTPLLLVVKDMRIEDVKSL